MMIDTNPSLWDKTLELLFKVLIPASLGVGIKIAIKMQKEKMTLLAIMLSFFVGIAFAWLASPYIFGSVSSETASLVIAVVAMSGEKIGEYIIYRWNVDVWLALAGKNFSAAIVNTFKSKSE